MPAQLIEAPESDASRDITPLAYLDAYDAVLNDDYAFVAFKESDRSGGAWRLRIKGRHTTGVVFEPEAMRLQARSAGAQSRPFFTWGAGIDPSNGDPRSIQYIVHVKNSMPSSIEIRVRTRNADHSAAAEKSVSFNWPG